MFRVAGFLRDKLWQTEKPILVLDHDDTLMYGEASINQPIVDHMLADYQKINILTRVDLHERSAIERLMNTEKGLTAGTSPVEIATVQDLFWHLNVDVVKEFIETLDEKINQQESSTTTKISSRDLKKLIKD